MGVVFSLPLKKDQDEEGPQFNGGKSDKQHILKNIWMWWLAAAVCFDLVLLDLHKQTPRLA